LRLPQNPRGPERYDIVREETRCSGRGNGTGSAIQLKTRDISNDYTGGIAGSREEKEHEKAGKL